MEKIWVNVRKKTGVPCLIVTFNKSIHRRTEEPQHIVAISGQQEYTPVMGDAPALTEIAIALTKGFSAYAKRIEVSLDKTRDKTVTIVLRPKVSIWGAKTSFIAIMKRMDETCIIREGGSKHAKRRTSKNTQV